MLNLYRYFFIYINLLDSLLKILVKTVTNTAFILNFLDKIIQNLFINFLQILQTFIQHILIRVIFLYLQFGTIILLQQYLKNPKFAVTT